MKYKKEYNIIKKYINNAKSVVIIPHISPDPDAFASSFAIARALLNQNKKCFIALQERPDNHNKYSLPDTSLVILPKDISSTAFDLIITVDIGAKKRVGEYINILDAKTPVINLDHHIDNEGFGDVNIVDSSYSSTSELVYEMLTAIDAPLTKEMAIALYTGIVFDTGSFRYSLTTKKTHKFASELLAYTDIDTNAIYESLFEDMSASTLRLINKVSSTLQTFNEGKICLFYLRKSFFAECDAREIDANNLVKIGGSLKGVVFSIFIKEKDESNIRVSLRSKIDEIKVNEIAKEFGGGGHQKASAFTLDVPFDDAYNLLIEQIARFA